MQSSFLTPHDLATRWNTTPNTLSQWRWNGRGPQFFKIGRRVLYKIHDIEIFEDEKCYQNTSQTPTAKKVAEFIILQKKKG
jgi:hypothetical protein